MNVRRWSRLGVMLALATVAVAALLGPIGSAVGFLSGGLFLDVRVQSPGKLVARGAAIEVPLEVTCTSPEAELFVQVRQRVGGGAIAQGEAFEQIACTRSRQEVTVTVFASGAAFKKGTALAEAQIFGCLQGSGCGSESDTAEIAIVRKS